MQRIEILKKLEELFSEVRVPVSFGVCGSTAMGFARKDSDMDLWICLNREQVHSFFSEPSVQKLLNWEEKSKLYSPVIDELRQQVIDVLNVKFSLGGAPCSLDVYTRHSFADVCRLRAFWLRRWREKGIGRTTINFKNVHGEFIDFDCRVDGWYSEVKNVVVHNGLYHFGQHVNRVCSSKIVFDKLDVLEDMLILWIKIFIHAKHHNANDPLKFLYKSEQIPSDIETNLSSNLENIKGLVEKCQELLKSMVMTTPEKIT